MTIRDDLNSLRDDHPNNKYRDGTWSRMRNYLMNMSKGPIVKHEG